MIFNWIRLGIGMVTVFFCMLIFAVAWLLVTKLALALSTTIAVACTAFLLAVAIYYFIMIRYGYGIKLGQLAIVGMAHSNSDIPSNPVEFSKSVVTNRFGGSRHYYALARRLSLALGEIYSVIGRGFRLGTDAPELRSSKRWLHCLSRPALGYADECCLCYALNHPDGDMHETCVDALTLFVQNWDDIIKGAAKTSLIVIFLTLGLGTLLYLPGLAASQAFENNSLPWLGISFMLALTFKIAFLDSWILIRMVTQFLTLSEETKLESSYYEKLEHWSKSYAKLRKK